MQGPRVALPLHLGHGCGRHLPVHVVRGSGVVPTARARVAVQQRAAVPRNPREAAETATPALQRERGRHGREGRAQAQGPKEEQERDAPPFGRCMLLFSGTGRELIVIYL